MKKKTTKKIKLSFNQLFSSKRFRDKYQIDLSKTILGDKLYTVKEAETILDKYFKR